MKKIFKIYALTDDETVKYIGVTSRELSQRLYQHIWEGKHKKGTYKINWIKSLLNNNKKPSIKLIEECTKETWQEREKYWIKYYNNLTNTLEGGCGIVIKKKPNLHKQKRIVCFNLQTNDILIFNSVNEASIQTNCLRTAIGNVLKNRSKTSQGYYFCYYNDYINNNCNIPKTKTIRHKSNSKIIQITNDVEKVWNSTKEAAKKLNINAATIRMALHRGYLSQGSYWKYLN